MSLHFNDLFLGSALPFKNVRLQVCGPRSRGGYHRILKAVRTPALSSFCPPLSSAQRSRLHLRDSLFTTREEGGREGGRGRRGRKRKIERKKEEEKEEKERKKGKASTRSFRAAQLPRRC